MTAEDSDEIDKLQSLISEIRLQKKGALALSADSQEELDLLENRLNKAEKAVGKMSLDELRDEEGKVDDIFNSTLASSPDLTQEEAWEAMQASMDESGISTQARDNWFVERLSDRYTAFHSRDYEMTPDASEALWKGYNDLGDDFNARRQYIYAADIPSKIRAQMLDEVRRQESQYRQRVESSLKDAHGLLNNVAGQSNRMQDAAMDIPGVDATDASVLGENRAQSAVNAAMAAAEDATQRGLSDEEQAIAVREAVVQNDKLWSQVTINGGADYNVELARELAQDNSEVFPPEILRTMENISQASAVSTLGIGAIDPATGATPEQMELERGSWYWYDRASVSNVNDVANLWKSSTTPTSKKQIGELNRETIKDAVAGRAEFNTLYLNVNGRKYMDHVGEEGVVVWYAGAAGAQPPDPTPEQLQNLEEIRPIDADKTAQYVSFVRLSGLSQDEMRSGKTEEGLDISNYADLRNPYKTLMVNPDTFADDLANLEALPDGLSPEELQEQYGSNGIVSGYLAYREMVGINDAISFNEGKENFVILTLSGIGRYTLPVPDASVLKALTSE